ncbi:MAG: thiolase family protein, partial [Thermoanaerobaculales bacterium]|nr:thiolase family protein [Thermoanaerobaculales bacterium]
MREAVIVSAARTAIGRAKKGSLRDTRPEYFASKMIEGLVERTPGLEKEKVGDIIMGCAMPEGEQGMNVARLIGLAAGFPTSVPAITVHRFCCSGSQTIALAADSIRTGNADIVIAGGVESMSMVAMGGNKPIAYPGLMNSMPNAYAAMGTTAEGVARRFEITREMQDEFAYNSHRKAAAAIEAGKFKDEIVPLDVRVRENGTWREFVFDTDEGPRPDTTVEGLAKLRPVFDPMGTVTAGNASQINDGAGAVVIMGSDTAETMGLEPMAFVRHWAVAGVDPDVMGIGPAVAVPKLLKKAGVTLDDIDLVEINEAFASVVLAWAKETGADPEKVNVNGGAISLGHPLGATGARLMTTLLHELERSGGRYG